MNVALTLSFKLISFKHLYLQFYYNIILDTYLGGAADFKMGYKTGFTNGPSGKQFLYPTFPNVRYKQANISRGLLNILKFAVWLSH